MLQSQEVTYRTEIAQLKAELYQLRFALPLKKACEETLAQWDTELSEEYWMRNLGLCLKKVREILKNKERYEAKDDVPLSESPS